MSATFLPTVFTRRSAFVYPHSLQHNHVVDIRSIGYHGYGIQYWRVLQIRKNKKENAAHLLLTPDDPSVLERDDYFQMSAKWFDVGADTSVLQRLVDTGPVVVETAGNLLENLHETQAIAHCVSSDFRMGAGVALQIRRYFGGVAQLLDTYRHSPAGTSIVVQQVHRDTSSPMLVYHLVTKQVYCGKPTYNSLRASVVAMRDDLIARGCTSVSIPRLGCGLDRLEWSRVRPMLEEIFAGTGVRVVVRVPPAVPVASSPSSTPSDDAKEVEAPPASKRLRISSD